MLSICVFLVFLEHSAVSAYSLLLIRVVNRTAASLRIRYVFCSLLWYTLHLALVAPFYSRILRYCVVGSCGDMGVYDSFVALLFTGRQTQLQRNAGSLHKKNPQLVVIVPFARLVVNSLGHPGMLCRWYSLRSWCMPQYATRFVHGCGKRCQESRAEVPSQAEHGWASRWKARKRHQPISFQEERRI